MEENGWGVKSSPIRMKNLKSLLVRVILFHVFCQGKDDIFDKISVTQSAQKQVQIWKYNHTNLIEEINGVEYSLL